ncbi:MAG: methyltransferase domain-containing protein [Candidatus Omnitrophota bacterium]
MKTSSNMPVLKRLGKSVIPKVLKDAITKILLITKQDINFFYNWYSGLEPRPDKSWVNDFHNIIVKIFNPKSVIDFGCGRGEILAPFEKKGLAILGLDGSRVNKKKAGISQDNFLVHDLRNGYSAVRRYDLCFCFEVAEHIEEKYSRILIAALTKSSPLIIFTASPPGTGGHCHCNEKPAEWWIGEFRKFMYDFDREATERLKRDMMKIRGIQEYYISNLIIFREIAT